MPVFEIKDKKLKLIKSKEFKTEKELQKLVEENLDSIFSCRFIASEFSTGSIHAGRIDTIALSEENNPVIIEYKKVESSELINQSLYYLSWMRDHKGDFQIAVNKSLGAETEIDWSDIRVICIAPGYRKYDIHAVKMMGANIELWQYKLYENGIIYFEDIYRRKVDIVNEEEISSNKNPIMVAAGKKAAETRATGVYSVEEHFENINDELKKTISEVRDYILSLNESILEVPKKFYIAYKLNKNFTCLEVKSNKVILFLKLDPETIKPLPKGSRDVTNIGHYGTGNLEFTINNKDDLPKAFELIKLSFEEIGG